MAAVMAGVGSAAQVALSGDCRALRVVTAVALITPRQAMIRQPSKPDMSTEAPVITVVPATVALMALVNLVRLISLGIWVFLWDVGCVPFPRLVRGLIC